PVGLLGGEADRVSDRARLHLVPAHQPGEKWQAGGIGRRPSQRAQRVRAEGEDRARPCRPRRSAAGEIVELVQRAGIAVDDQRVTIAAILDERIGPNRIWPQIALARVLERDRYRWMGVPDDVVGKAVWWPPKIRMQFG